MMAVLGAVMAVHSACPRAPVMSTGARRSYVPAHSVQAAAQSRA